MPRIHNSHRSFLEWVDQWLEEEWLHHPPEECPV